MSIISTNITPAPTNKVENTVGIDSTDELSETKIDNSNQQIYPVGMGQTGSLTHPFGGSGTSSAQNHNEVPAAVKPIIEKTKKEAKPVVARGWAFGITAECLVLFGALAGLSANNEYRNKHTLAYTILVIGLANIIPDTIAYYEDQYTLFNSHKIAAHQSMGVVLAEIIILSIVFLPIILFNSYIKIERAIYFLLITILLINNYFALEYTLLESIIHIIVYIMGAIAIHSLISWLHKRYL